MNNDLDVNYGDTGLSYYPFTDPVHPRDLDWYDFEPTAATKSDKEIRNEIRDELWWSPFVDADQVAVTVEDGTATLTGAVDSWFERQKASENAREGGAVHVVNNLTFVDQTEIE